MKRVVQIVTQLALGGAQRLAIELARRVPEGWEGHLWAGPGGELEVEAEADPRLHFRRVPSLGRKIDALADAAALRELVELMREVRPDIVHTHSSKAGILGRQAAWLAGVRDVVHTVHGWSFHPGLSSVMRALYVTLERAAAAQTRILHCVCHADVEKGLAAGVGVEGQYRVVHGGIDPAPYASLPPKSSGPPTVVTLSCLKRQKGLEDWHAVAARVREKIPDARFVIAGEGELRGELEERRRALGLERAVEMPGWVRDVPALLGSADVFLLTSHWEGFPLAVLEAMAAGVPVVATAVDGTPEAVEEGVTGYLVGRGEVETMAERVESLLRDEGLRRAMGTRGRERVIARFTIKQFVEGVVAVYRSAFPSRPSPGSPCP